jgi:hypothetical protein
MTFVDTSSFSPPDGPAAKAYAADAQRHLAVGNNPGATGRGHISMNVKIKQVSKMVAAFGPSKIIQARSIIAWWLTENRTVIMLFCRERDMDLSGGLGSKSKRADGLMPADIAYLQVRQLLCPARSDSV